MREAKTIDELRQAQAIIFPLDFGLSIEKTAQAIGISRGWACQLRRSFIKGQMQPKSKQLPRRKLGSGRGRSYLNRLQEQELLLPFVEKAGQAGILIVSEIRQALVKKLGRTTATATTYNLLHRHGWRKLSPDKKHPKADIEAQNEWKKTS
ncbi:MAG: winged helix-turn-helix domain-containing protein [Candidatus Nitrotoga sp.]